MKKFLLFILVCIAFTGCATLFSGSRQSMVFSAPAGTKIFSDGILLAEVPEGYDAVSIMVDRRLGGMNMMARKEGYKDTLFFVRSQVNGTVFVNILLGPAMLLGGAIDLITGSAAKYPNYIQIGMEPLDGRTTDNVNYNLQSGDVIVDNIDNILQY